MRSPIHHLAKGRDQIGGRATAGQRVRVAGSTEGDRERRAGVRVAQASYLTLPPIELRLVSRQGHSTVRLATDEVHPQVGVGETRKHEDSLVPPPALPQHRTEIIDTAIRKRCALGYRRRRAEQPWGRSAPSGTSGDASHAVDEIGTPARTCAVVGSDGPPDCGAEGDIDRWPYCTLAFGTFARASEPFPAPVEPMHQLRHQVGRRQIRRVRPRRRAPKEPRLGSTARRQ